MTSPVTTSETFGPGTFARFECRAKRSRSGAPALPRPGYRATCRVLGR
ncbi:MAG TPA: hypothetical protein VNA20_17355 [Frankiaceae bacterium]|nr:hypothetical protein [Frankiaceae bacterium]